MHILIVEDDLDLGRALLQALKTEGITSEWVRSAADARASLDVSLPDGTGYDLLSGWRRAGVTLPIIIITARSAFEERVAGLDGGADDFLVKPFVTAEWEAKCRSRTVWTGAAVASPS